MTADQLDFGLALLRVLVAFVMLAHGWNHIFRGGRIEGTAGWFESLGMRPPMMHAWLASLTELAAGVGLLLGLLTPLAAAGVVGIMTVAWITNHLGNGYFIFREGEGWEWVATLAFAAVALGTMGPGSWSLDDAFGIEISGAASLGVTLIGAIAALVLLAVFWRPSEAQRKNPLNVAAVFAAFLVVGALGLPLIDASIADRVSDPDQISYGVLVLRIAIAAVMLAHGWNHIFRGGKITGTAGWFDSLGMRPGILHAWLASVTELSVGMLLLFGLLTPLAAAGVVGVMVVAWVTNHVGNGYFTFRPGEGWEYVSFLAVSAVVVGTIGGGRYSLDEEFELTTDVFRGFNGLFITLAGAAAALLLLVVFWRPEKMRPPAGVAAVFALFVVLGIIGAGLVVAEEPASDASTASISSDTRSTRSTTLSGSARP